MRFRATLRATGGTTTGIVVPPEVVEQLGGGRRPKVTVTLNGQSYRTSVAPMGGEYWVGVSAANRALTGVAAGEELDVDLELDEAPREVEVPEDLAAAFRVTPDAGAAFARLSYSHQRAHVEAVTGAKKPETRQRRVDKVVDMLTGGERENT
jgi:hypothetical protein